MFVFWRFSGKGMIANFAPWHSSVHLDLSSSILCSESARLVASLLKLLHKQPTHCFLLGEHAKHASCAFVEVKTCLLLCIDRLTG